MTHYQGKHQAATSGASTFHKSSHYWVVGGENHNPPHANFVASPLTGTEPEEVTFTNLTIGNCSGQIWDFGDGDTSAMPSPVHTYNAGLWTVSLYVENAFGHHTLVKTDYIGISGISKPIALFSADKTSGSPPLTVQFTDESMNGPTSWAWDFGDTGTSTAQSPSHEYANAGTYTVTLRATNLHGFDDEVKTDYITVSATQPPVAAFSADVTSGKVPLTVQFTDSSTNTPTTWAWDFGDTGTSTAQNPSHEYAAAGTYTVKLTATNAGGSDDEEKTDYITVSALQPPVAAFSADVTSGYAPLTVQFTDSSTNTPTSWGWDFGDGNYSVAQNPSHEYAADGTYTVTLTAYNADGNDSEIKTDYITVTNQYMGGSYTYSRNSTARKKDYSQVASGAPRFEAEGLTLEMGMTNAAAQSVALSFDTAQNVTIASGYIYTVSCGSGTITLSGAGTGTVTPGSPATFTSTGTTLTLTPTGTVEHAQVENWVINTCWHDGGATRAEDVFTIGTTNWSTTAGTIEFILDVTPSLKTTYYNNFVIAHTTNAGSYYDDLLFGVSGANFIVASTNGSGTLSSFAYALANVTNEKHRMALRWQSTRLSLVIDGTEKAYVINPNLPSAWAATARIGKGLWANPDSGWMNTRIMDLLVSNVYRDDTALSTRNVLTILDDDANTVWHQPLNGAFI